MRPAGLSSGAYLFLLLLNGSQPLFRPQYTVFPKDPNGFAIDDQFYVGSSGLLVKPVTRPGATEETVYLAEDEVYYDYFSYKAYHGSAKGKTITVQAELHQIPLFIRGGSIVPTRERPRRSSTLMAHDPFTLRVALSKDGSARGDLYLDDGVTYEHEKGALVWRQFVASSAGKGVVTIKSSDLAKTNPASAALTVYDPANAYAQSIKEVRIEKIVVLGLKGKPSSVKLADGTELKWEYEGGASSDGSEGAASVLTIKDPKTSIVTDWELTIKL